MKLETILVGKMLFNKAHMETVNYVDANCMNFSWFQCLGIEFVFENSIKEISFSKIIQLLTFRFE